MSNLEIEVNKRAISMLPRGWNVERGADILDGDGKRAEYATAEWYVLDGRTDIAGEGNSIIEAVADALSIPVENVRNYAMRKQYSAEDVKRIADRALYVMCHFVQTELGQTDGGIAGMFWDGNSADIIRAYVETEIRNLYVEE